MVKFIQEQLKAGGGNISIDEATLVSGARAGNMASVEKLILKYQDRVYNTILKMCGNEADAAELAQDAFVKAIEGLKNFRGESSFYTWLFRIAVNLTLNFCKRNAKLSFQSLQEQIGEDTNRQLKDYLVDKSAAEPSELAAKKEVHSLIARAIEKLEPQQRAVIILRDIEQMSYNEIAETLEMEIGTVKSRIARGRKNLREILEAAIQ
ncbi:MAG: sigma-70 family RNA polymerase sigma factor [Planctomycetes bacterium]|nr:sigma-70 family RNA polymerase sigma factor [Planctomycetota bacterium]MBU1518299.1 sigma-70 family RNA polymerase sigma factor [Planctomycetota bacterium]MBU2457874.1 sigma-70 family RNA polymerase sigma factor [Planctomycetota bacterium]MBU2596822.1 sigma-70 family RNA polymerase sigma factor [Planctomycetota bacterium]